MTWRCSQMFMVAEVLILVFALVFAMIRALRGPAFFPLRALVIGYIDLMKIEDPNRLARKPLTDGVLTFPFFTIENVDIVDSRHIVVGNDNNLPFSSSREPNQADDNELVLLEVADFLAAR